MNTGPTPTHRREFEQQRRSSLAFQPCGKQQPDVCARRSARMDTRWGA